MEFDTDRYRQRNIVERLIGWLKECRCIFARFEKTATNFKNMIKTVFIQRSLQILENCVRKQSPEKIRYVLKTKAINLFFQSISN